MEGRRKIQGGDICIPMADYVDAWQKPTPYCKAIVLQLKKEQIHISALLTMT